MDKTNGIVQENEENVLWFGHIMRTRDTTLNQKILEILSFRLTANLSMFNIRKDL